MRRFIEAGIIAAAIGITTASCSGDNSSQQIEPTDSSPRIEENGIVNFKSKYLGYTLKYPIEWTVTTESDESWYVDSFVLDPSAYETSQIVISALPSDEKTSLETMVEATTGGQIPAADGPLVDGVESKIIDVLDILGGKSQMIIFVKNGSPYTIAYYAPKKELEKTRGVFNEMLTSFHIVEPPKTPAPDSEAGYY